MIMVNSLSLNAQRTRTASIRPASPAVNSIRSTEKIPPLWGEKPNGLRIEIRIANNAFVQSNQAIRENNVVDGTYYFVNAFHPAPPGTLAGHYDVAPINEETALSFSRSGIYRSVKAENGFTVFRLTQYGDVPKMQQLGFAVNTTAWVQRNILRPGIVVSGNTLLNGTQANTATMGGQPIVITVSAGTLK
jgi:hypothetical protein